MPKTMNRNLVAASVETVHDTELKIALAFGVVGYDCGIAYNNTLVIRILRSEL